MLFLPTPPPLPSPLITSLPSSSSPSPFSLVSSPHLLTPFPLPCYSSIPPLFYVLPPLDFCPLSSSHLLLTLLFCLLSFFIFSSLSPPLPYYLSSISFLSFAVPPPFVSLPRFLSTFFLVLLSSAHSLTPFPLIPFLLLSFLPTFVSSPLPTLSPPLISSFSALFLYLISSPLCSSPLLLDFFPLLSSPLFPCNNRRRWLKHLCHQCRLMF